jgi:replication factor C large subunit
MTLDNFNKEIISENFKHLDINFDEIKNSLKNEEKEYFLPWFLKYKLEKYGDLIQTNEIKQIEDYVKSPLGKKPILLFGQAGSGKTTTLITIGNHFEYEIFELNASDTRNKKSIIEILDGVIKQRSLFSKNKLIIIDEVDGISGTNDRGGVAQIVKYVQESKFPIVFSANDGESPKLKPLKRVCKFINFENQLEELLIKLGNFILTSENINFKKEDINKFVSLRNPKDIRGFINDLQASVIDNEFILDDEFEIRDYKQKINNFLTNIFYSYPEDSLKNSFYQDIKIDELFLYLEENVPYAYDKIALYRAFEEISKADLFRGRIIKWQYWRFLVYINFYLNYGVCFSKTNPKKVLRFEKNKRILKKWIYNNSVGELNPRTKIQRKKEEPKKFIENLADLYKSSAKRTRSRILPYFVFIYRNDLKFRDNMNKVLKINSKTQEILLQKI